MTIEPSGSSHPAPRPAGPGLPAGKGLQAGAGLQSGAVPVKRSEEGEWLVLLITSSRDRWILPKGRLKRRDDPRSTAIRETEEESGVRGVLLGEPLGRAQIRKRRRSIEIEFYLLLVEGETERWKERHRRARAWLSFPDAIDRVEDAELARILDAARARLESSGDSDSVA